MAARETDGVGFAPPDITDDDLSAVRRVLESGWLTTGEECQALERELSAYLGGAHVVTLASCSAALETAVASLGLPRGARVGVPTWTFVSTALSAVHTGAVPVLLDVEPDTLNLSAQSLEPALGELDAVLLVHFGGVPVASAVHDLCRSSRVAVIEDAAHALGASDWRGRVAGQGSAAACFSFYATKNLTSGEGGALATDDPDLASFARSYRLHGLSADAWARYRPGAGSGYDLLLPGIKANLPDVLAALARSQLSRFDQMQARRRSLVRRYRRHLDEMEGVRPVPLHLIEEGADHLMAVELPPWAQRDRLARAMAARGVSTSVHFQPLHRFTWFRDHAAIGPMGTPVADALCGRILTLPLSSALEADQIDRVCDVLAHELKQERRISKAINLVGWAPA